MYFLVVLYYFISLDYVYLSFCSQDTRSL